MTRQILASLFMAAVLAGCGSSTVSTTTLTTSANTTPTHATTAATNTTTAAPDTTSATTPGPPVPVGRTVLLSYSSVIGQGPDTQLSVTVNKVFPIQASGYANLSPPDPLPYGVDITIKNHDSSTTTYDNGPDGRPGADDQERRKGRSKPSSAGQWTLCQ